MFIAKRVISRGWAVGSRDLMSQMSSHTSSEFIKAFYSFPHAVACLTATLKKRFQQGQWCVHSAPPPGPESWSLPCRWPPATRRSDLLSIDRSWTTAWAWHPAPTHSSMCSLSAQPAITQTPLEGANNWETHCQLIDWGAHQVVLQDRPVCDFCCRLKTPVARQQSFSENKDPPSLHGHTL